MQRIGNPVPLFIDLRGLLLDGGEIYVGAQNADPEVSPINVFSDQALTIPLAQPIQTLGGFAVSGTVPVFMFVAEDNFSIRVRDNTGAQVSYTPSYYSSTSSFQPLDADLTAIAALTTTTYGRSLLTLANVAALQAQLGGLNYLPLAGGTMTGETTHQGAGVELYHNDSAMTSGRIFYTDASGTDPTTASGQIWFKGTS